MSRNRMVAMNIIREDGVTEQQENAEKERKLKLMNQRLANRPSRNYLEKRNVLRSLDEGQSISTGKARNLLSRRILARPDRKSLIRMGVISEHESAQLHEAKQKLKKSARRNSLLKKLSQRVTLSHLQSRGIYRPQVVDESHSEFAQARSSLGALLEKRADKGDLESKGILSSDGEQKKEKKAKRAALSALFSRRPSRQFLVNQRLLRDIGGKSAEDEGDCFEFKQVPIEPLAEISLGHGHSAALRRSGTVCMIGHGGEGGGSGQSDKTDIAITNVTHIACGIDHTVITAGGCAYSWGAGNWGRLGLGHQLSVSSPQQVPLNDETVQNAECGTYHSLILTESNKVFGFGWNKNGCVAASEAKQVSSPQQISIPTDGKIVGIAAGNSCSFALDDAGKLFSWGRGLSGVLGHGDQKARSQPTAVAALADEKVLQLAVGGSHAMALTDSNKLFTWGSNNCGQLGREAKGQAALCPTAIALDGKGVSSIACGRNHSGVVKEGVLYMFGHGAHGILGLGTTDDKAAPAIVSLPGGKAAAIVSLGMTHSACITTDGSLFTCGRRQHGQLGHD